MLDEVSSCEIILWGHIAEIHPCMDQWTHWLVCLGILHVHCLYVRIYTEHVHADVCRGLGTRLTSRILNSGTDMRWLEAVMEPVKRGASIENSPTPSIKSLVSQTWQEWFAFYWCDLTAYNRFPCSSHDWLCIMATPPPHNDITWSVLSGAPIDGVHLLCYHLVMDTGCRHGY